RGGTPARNARPSSPSLPRRGQGGGLVGRRGTRIHHAPIASTAAPVKSFFHVVTTDEAWARIAALEPVRDEIIRVAAALGRVLAEDLVAPADLPHFHRANMDGYAVRAADT